MLLNKKGKLCIEKIGTEARKDKNAVAVCTKTGKEEYIYPSERGFWFVDLASLKLQHLSLAGFIETDIALKNFKAIHIRGISNSVAVREFGTTDLYSLGTDTIERGEMIEKTCDSDDGTYFGLEETNPKFLGLVCFRTDKQAYSVDITAKEIVNGKIKTSHQVGTIKVSSKRGELHRVWLRKSASADTFILTTDFTGHLSLYNEKGKLQFEKSTDLSNIRDVLVAEYPSVEDTEGEIPRYEAYGNNFVGAFIYRLLTDGHNLAEVAKSLLKKATSITFVEILDSIRGKNSGGITEELNYYNKYGLRKNLIFVTNSNKLVSVDSLGGKEQWTTALKPGQTILKAMINAHNNIDLIYIEDNRKKRTELSSIDGSFTTQDTLIDQKAQIFLEGEEDQAPIEIGLNSNYLKNTNHEYVFYKVERERGISGYRHTKAGRFEERWNYLLEPGQEILDYSYHLKGDDQYISKAARGSTVTLPEEEALYFKVVDPSNVALLIKQTVNNKAILILTIINTVRGKVLGTYQNGAVDFSQPLAFIYDDNGIYVSYFSTQTMGFELWSTEIFRIKIETSFYEMYFFPK